MVNKFAKSFISSRCRKLDHVPIAWSVTRRKDVTKYILDLRMTSMTNFYHQAGYAFDLISASSPEEPNSKSKPREASTLEDPFRYPELICKIELSLNELVEIKEKDLQAFVELRSLDLSLNNLERFQGISVASKLCYLNVSYNKITQLPHQAIEQCVGLKHLNLSANKLRSISKFPALADLTVLDVSCNKLANLDGMQRLRSLHRLYAQDNCIVSAIHMCACLELTEANLSNNKLDTMSDVISMINPLHKLQQLYVAGNPISSNVSQLELRTLVAEGSNVTILDGFNIKPIREQFMQFSLSDPPSIHDDVKTELKNAVHEVMNEKMKMSHEKMHQNVKYYQKKIHMLLKNFEKEQDKMELDKDSWCRYIDTLSTKEAQVLTVSKFRASALTQFDGITQQASEPSSSNNLT